MKILVVDDRSLGARKLRDDILSAEPEYQVEMAVGEGQAADRAKQIVRAARERFDVFLIDDNMGAGLSGNELMTELRQLSPSSEAIIFTAYADEEGKRRAIEAGARAYVPRPVNEKELLWQLHGVQKERSTRRERDWLQLLASTTKKLQEATTIQGAGQAIVEGVQHLGFQRAWLRMACGGQGEQIELIGVSQVGSDGWIDDFTTTKRSLKDLPYFQKALCETKKPTLFLGRELGPTPWDEYVTPPKDDWFVVPLFVGEEPIGTLSLDNGIDPCRYSGEEQEQIQQLLDLFGKQAAAALERARLYERTRQEAEEVGILSEIGRQVTAAAALGDLNELLDEVRRQIANLMDVTNFMVVLKDLETDDLDFRRQYKQGERFQRHWRAAEQGLVSLVISKDAPILIHDMKDFYVEHSIRYYGPPMQCWLGVPLRVEGQSIGALAMQSYENREAYTVQHQQLLQKVADQVAGAIRLAYEVERHEELARKEQALKDLERALPQLPQELDFWHAVLTTTTHRDGNSFNRAALFWYSATGEQMQGRMGIGYFRGQDARLTWEEAERVNASLSDYFAAPHRARRRPTPLEQRIAQWRLDTGAPQGPCYRVWAQGKRQVISSAALCGCLPDELLQPPDLLDDATNYPCALLPVKSKDGVLGLLVVDNAFNGEPLRHGDLNKLEELLGMVMHLWLRAREADQTERLGEAYEQVLTVSHRIRAHAADGQVRTALEVLCHEAQKLTQADCVVVYPYHPSSDGFDLSLVSHLGLYEPEEFKATTRAKPRQHGVTFNVLRSGTLVVPDITRSDLSFAGRRLIEHAFLQREAIKALIGVPLREPATGEPLGVLYLNYRSPQEFDQRHIALAEHLAAIGADAIRYVRAVERAAAEAREQRRQRDMQLLANIQMQALASDADESKVVRSILQNAAELFGRPVDVTVALLSWEAEGEENRQVRRDWRIDQQGRLRSRRVDLSKGPIGEALRQGIIIRAGNALAIPILFGEKSLAALMVKRPGRGMTFGSVEQEVAQRLATVAALALDSVRTRTYLQTISETVSAVSDLKGLEETLKRIVHMARQVAPDIDCVTLWHEDLEKGRLVAGPQWGVRHDKNKRKNAQTDRLVRAVMGRQAPTFATVTERDPILLGEFTRDEDIVSTAAFPLRFGARQQALGALFFNYRKAHEFSPVERTLFPIFANAAATAIHSAQTIDLAERRGRRLETALKVATQAGATLNEDAMVRGVLAVLRDEFRRGEDDKTAPYFMRYDDRDRVLELHPVAQEFYQPARHEYQHRVRLPLEGPGITCQTAREALAEGRVVVENVPNVHNYKGYVEVNSETNTEMCAGLVSEGQLLGALVIKSTRAAAFDEDDVRLFEMAAQQVALALDRLEQIAKAQRSVSVSSAMAWAADLAHDLNKDVGFIRSRSFWLKEREKNLSEQGLTWVGEIDQRAQQLADVVRDTSAQQNTQTSFSLEDLLREKLAPWRQRNAFDFEIRTEEVTDYQLLAHREQTWRVLRHLLRNGVEAIEATEDAPHLITLRTRLVDPNQIEIQVEDTGRGVSDDVRQRIFRVPYSTKDEVRGFGLLIAQHLVESMGGSIHLHRSDKTRGALFAIRLPLAR